MVLTCLLNQSNVLQTCILSFIADLVHTLSMLRMPAGSGLSEIPRTSYSLPNLLSLQRKKVIVNSEHFEGFISVLHMNSNRIASKSAGAETLCALLY